MLVQDILCPSNQCLVHDRNINQIFSALLLKYREHFKIYEYAFAMLLLNSNQTVWEMKQLISNAKCAVTL